MPNPELRKELIVKRQVQGKQIYYIIKDPFTMEYFRFSENEYFILELLDGTRDNSAVLKRSQQILPDLELEMEDITDFLGSVKKMNLFIQTEKEKNLMLIEKRREERKNRILSQKGSIFYKRFPVVDPNDFFDRIIDRIRFFWTPQFIFFSMGVMSIALLILYMNWYKVLRGAKAIFSLGGMTAGNMAMLWGIVLIIIGFHELGHGLTCKNFGGEVHEMGFLLLFFQPCLYCNVSDAWTFDRKSHKLWVTFAGGYVEFFLGSIAVIIWALTQEKTLINTLMFQAFTVCSVSAVLFNFNPLIKLDGYYAFSDFFELPNLKDSSIEYIKYLAVTKVFRMPWEFPEIDEDRVKILFGYGICATIYMTSLIIGLFFMAQGFLVSSLGAAGVVISFFLAFKMFKGHVVGAFEFIKEFVNYHEKIFKNPRILGTVAVVFLVLIYAVFLARYNLVVENECALEFNRVVPVRPLYDGYIVKNEIKKDLPVKKGQLLALLEDPDLNIELLNARLDTQILNLNLGTSQAMRDIPQVQKKRIQLTAAESEIQDIEKKLKSFGIVSLSNGSILNPAEGLDAGMKIKAGDLLCEIADTSDFKIEMAVDERDIGDVSVKNPVELKFYALPSEVFEGYVSQISPVAEKKGISRTFNVTIIVKNKYESLKNGMKGIARIIPRKEGFLHLVWRKISRILRTDLLF